MSHSRLAAVAAIALAVLAVAPDAGAQQLTRSGMRARPAVITQEDILDAAARAEGYAQDGQFALARREYREAAALQLRVRELPESSLRQVAAAYYAEGSPARAAEALEELASLPLAQQDPNVRARALFDAAFLYRAPGQWQRPREIQRELRALAASGVLDAELTAQIERRMR
jgi:hypothetical protein